MRRLLLWEGVDEWRTEAAEVDLGEGGLRATGTQIGLDPIPYALRYALDVGPDLLTRSLEVEATGDGWRRRLLLARSEDGAWSAGASDDGDVGLPAPGGDTGALRGATDCDLGRSPLTNLMPLRRAGLHAGPGTLDLDAAWVAVPELTVHRSAQRYEHVALVPPPDHPGPLGGHAATVRYVDRGTHDGFTAELAVDEDGFVLLYPELARRVPTIAVDSH